MPRIFISYRRDDSRAMAGRIYDRLVQAFGDENIFKDVDRIPPGSTFAEVLDAELAKCNVLLIIIGRLWVNITDKAGRRRLDDPGDFVRIEVEKGLNREGLLVIPVLVDEAAVPNPADLPDSLDKIASLQVVQVRHDPDFHRDMNRLIDFLKILQHQEESVQNREQDRARRNMRRTLAGVGVFAIIAVLGFLALVANGTIKIGGSADATFDPAGTALAQVTQTGAAQVAAVGTTGAQASVEAILTQFVTETEIAATLTADSYTDTPTATHTPSHTPTATDTPTETPTQTPSDMPTATAEAALTQAARDAQLTQVAINVQMTNDALATRNAPTNTPEPSATPTSTLSPTPSPTDTLQPTDTPTRIPSPTLTPTVTLTPTATINVGATQTAQALQREQAQRDAQATQNARQTQTAAIPTGNEDSPSRATPGQEVNMILLPRFVGIAVFNQAHQGALEAHAELENPGLLEFLGPEPANAVAGQVEIVTTAASRDDVAAIMISSNAGDQLVPALRAAKAAGKTVVTWDSPIPSGDSEDLNIAQVDFAETGRVMADMALSILGEDGGQFAILSASPDVANQNAWIASLEEVLTEDTYVSLELVGIVYGNDVTEESYNQALALVDQYPDLELIMAPTTVGIAAAAKAMQDEGLCETVKVSGLGLPAEMVEFTLNGCAPEFALWSFVDLGYVTYYATYLLATGAITAEEGVTFEAGRMGAYTIEKDPTRDVGLRIVLGWSVYNAENVEEAANPGGT